MDKLITSKPFRLTVFVVMAALISLVGFSGYVTAQKKLGCTPQPSLDRNSFQSVMQTIAEAWSRGDAKGAASCFAENAIYSGPPAVPRRGREALFQYFGGAKGRAVPMHMIWHQLVFDPV